jgi:hypothetical protein
MTLHISFRLSQSDLEFFRGEMQQALAKLKNVPEQQIIDSAKELLEKVEQSDSTDFIRDHMGQLHTLISMATDTGWGLIKDDRERVLAALSYFSEPLDLIPDDTPGLGYLDDAIMIEIVCKALEHEIQAYREFLIFRANEINRRGEEADDVQRTDWLEERRQQLHARMRRRRDGQASTKTKSPFSLF